MPLGITCRCKTCPAHDGPCGAFTPAPLCARCQKGQKTARTDRGRTYYHGMAWRKLRAACIRRDGDCTVCGSRVRLFAHHIKARDEGGADDIGNLMTLCQRCHNAYETDVRYDRDTEHRALVDAIGRTFLDVQRRGMR